MIITSSPCLPKSTYHCGNAISSTYCDLIARYNYYVRNNKEIISIPTPWNLHGLPYEKMYFEETLSEGTYNQILEYANRFLLLAEHQTDCFLDRSNYNRSHSDTQKSFIEFTINCFRELIEKGYIIKYHSEWYIDTSRFLRNYNLSEIMYHVNCSPPYHKKSIVKESQTFDGLYPITKNRVFTVKMDYKGEIIHINPIFQSFVYPIYLSERFHEDNVSVLVGGDGFSSLKWQYYRQIIGVILRDKAPIKTMAFHGTILGSDGKPMSKHSLNTILPSSIYAHNKDKNYLRYLLIRSISFNDIPLQINKVDAEYSIIKSKLRDISNNLSPLSNENEKILENVTHCMENYKYSLALEYFYLYLKKTTFQKCEFTALASKVKSLYSVFFI